MSGNSVNGRVGAPFRIEITHNSETDRQNLEGMLALFQKTHGTDGAQARFEFRMKTEGKGTNKRSFLELCEQTGFGRFRESLGSRSGDRARERQEALVALANTLGEDFVNRVVNSSEGSHLEIHSALRQLIPTVDRSMARTIRNLALEFTADGTPAFEIEPTKVPNTPSLDEIMAGFNQPAEQALSEKNDRQKNKPEQPKPNPLINPRPDRRLQNRQAGHHAAVEPPKVTQPSVRPAQTTESTAGSSLQLPKEPIAKRHAAPLIGVKAATLPQAGFANVTGNSCFMNGSLKVLIASAGPQLDAHLTALSKQAEFAPNTPKGQALGAFKALVDGSRKNGVRTETLNTFQRRLGRLIDPFNNKPYFPNHRVRQQSVDAKGVTRTRDVEVNFFSVATQWSDFYGKLETIFKLDQMPHHTISVRTRRGPNDDVKRRGESAIANAERAGQTVQADAKSAGGLQEIKSARINGGYPQHLLVDSGMKNFELYTGTLSDLVKDAGFGKENSFDNNGAGYFQGTWNERLDIKADWTKTDRITIDMGRQDYKADGSVKYVIYPNGDFDTPITVPVLDQNDQQISVTLVANEILCHTGTDQAGGHYFAFIRGDDGDWYLHNDSVITRVGQIPATVNDEYFGPVQISFGVQKNNEIYTIDRGSSLDPNHQDTETISEAILESDQLASSNGPKLDQAISNDLKTIFEQHSNYTYGALAAVDAYDRLDELEELRLNSPDDYKASMDNMRAIFNSGKTLKGWLEADFPSFNFDSAESKLVADTLENALKGNPITREGYFKAALLFPEILNDAFVEMLKPSPAQLAAAERYKPTMGTIAEELNEDSDDGI